MIPPRVKNAAATRETMLACARQRFLQESYENVGLRDIAGDAGVDVALVGRYFGSKEELFKEVVRSARGDWLDPTVGAAELPAWLAGLATQVHCPRAKEDMERLLIILRSASSPNAAAIVRESFRENVLAPVAGLIGGPDAEMRASMALGLIIGATILRSIMGVGALCDCDMDSVRDRLTSLLAAAIEPEAR